MCCIFFFPAGGATTQLSKLEFLDIFFDICTNVSLYMSFFFTASIFIWKESDDIYMLS